MGMFMSVPHVQVSGLHCAHTTHQGWLLLLLSSYYVATEITIIPHSLNCFFCDKNSIYKIDLDKVDVDDLVSICEEEEEISV